MDSATASLRSRRNQVIEANLDWLVDHGFRVSGEFVIDRNDGGFHVELLAEEGLTPATQAG